MVRLYDMSKDLPEEYLLAYARMVIWFGRLEGAVKLAIKNLAVSLDINKSFMDGLEEAEKKQRYYSMCDYIFVLHRRKYGECPETDGLVSLIKHLKKLADHRNHFVHSQWTVDDGKVIVLHSKWTKKAGLRSTRHVVPVESLYALRENIENAWREVHAARYGWAK